MKKSDSTKGRSASELIDDKLVELGDWRGETLSRMRKLIKEADPDIVEEWKWMDFLHRAPRMPAYLGVGARMSPS